MKIRLIIEKQNISLAYRDILKPEDNISIEQNEILLTPKQYKKVLKKIKEIGKIINLKEP